MKPVLASSMIPVGALVAFSVLADSATAPEGNRSERPAAVESAEQFEYGRPAEPGLVEAEVRWVDPTAGKLTVLHGQHNGLRMPTMTMVIRVKDSGQLAQLRAGDRISFAVQRINGRLTATVLRQAQ